MKKNLELTPYKENEVTRWNNPNYENLHTRDSL